MTDPSDGDRDPRALLDRAGTSGDRRRDQHFLVDDRVLERLPGYLPEDADRSHVLEVGGGAGPLTDRLLAVADRVTVVERDRDLAAFLREEFADAVADGRLSVVAGDALEVDLPEFSVSVSNLPYGISSEILFRLLPLGRPLVVTVQREFADRLAAEPGTDDYGRLTVTAGHYADVEIVEPVPPEAFSPPPAVDSAVVRLTPRDPDYAVPDDDLFADLVTGIFTQRRKTMRNAVRNTAHISGLDDPDAVVAAADEALMDRRPGTVTPTEFADLTALAAEEGVDDGG
jgi:16S rRNA (adenine1518-N6/adenine1519-N6)-dimethyltransferase